MLTTFTRMWLTRSTQPFRFTNRNDCRIAYADCCRLGLYVHIPFCTQICKFCPYCKVRYDKALCDRYLDALMREIHLVGGMHSGRKTVTSLYFGGGTPVLAADRLGEVMTAIRAHFEITEGVGVELHPNNVTPDILRKLKAAGVTKLSIGVQSFRKKYQRILGRSQVDADALRAALAEVPFETVSMDFIFALPTQTFADLKADIDTAFRIGANHIAIYPFIDFSFTPNDIPVMGKQEKRALLDAITAYCRRKGYVRQSIWTFARESHAGYSSMTRENFLGFGCSATTLLPDQFKINTFSVDAYCKRIAQKRLPTALTLRFTKRQRMIYYLFWTAYGMEIDAQGFADFFGVPLSQMYGMELQLAVWLGWLEKTQHGYRLTPEGAFYYHHFENYYTLAYIDHMWGTLRKEAFPKQITL